MAVHRWNWKAAGAGELNAARHGPVRYMSWKCIATLREYRNSTHDRGNSSPEFKVRFHGTLCMLCRRIQVHPASDVAVVSFESIHVMPHQRLMWHAEQSSRLQVRRKPLDINGKAADALGR